MKKGSAGSADLLENGKSVSKDQATKTGEQSPPEQSPPENPAFGGGRKRDAMQKRAPCTARQSSAGGPLIGKVYRPLWNNFITVAGVFLTAVAMMLLLTFGLFSIVTPTTNPYVDVVGYLVLPMILLFGIVLMPVGILFKSWRLARADSTLHLAFRFPRIDLNDPVQRRVAKFVVGGLFVMIPVIAVVSYHGYHFTDSTEFCTKACHQVMSPHGATYEHSAHARVACAECHIGGGASWFVKAKLSGTRQVLAVLTDSFDRPIPPAIERLRPARETCEQCHWPKKYFGAKLKEIVHFAGDEQNTRREVSMLLKIGGGDEASGRAEGIHLHMALEGRIEYLATDPSLQHIPWVRYLDAAGNEWVYRSDGKPISDPAPDGDLRRLDCMDCHNRPAHKFNPPSDTVDVYMITGRIDPTIPLIKRKAVEALVRPYPDADTAIARIGEALADCYETNHPDLWETRRSTINQAIDSVREIYRHNFFPDMKVDWRTYPDNIGHKYSPGCYRCHDGKHVNQNGEAISHQCNVCHTFLNPVEPQNGQSLIREGAFIHPIELLGVHATIRCDQCHTGGMPLAPSCEGCHTAVDAFRRGSLAAFDRFQIKQDAMAQTVDCESCHDLNEPTTLAAIDAMCMDCHDDEEERFEGMLASWKAEMDECFRAARKKADADARRILDQLKRVGVYHNIEASRTILKALATPTPPGATPRSADQPEPAID